MEEQDEFKRLCSGIKCAKWWPAFGESVFQAFKDDPSEVLEAVRLFRRDDYVISNEKGTTISDCHILKSIYRELPTHAALNSILEDEWYKRGRPDDLKPYAKQPSDEQIRELDSFYDDPKEGPFALQEFVLSRPSVLEKRKRRQTLPGHLKARSTRLRAQSPSSGEEEE